MWRVRYEITESSESKESKYSESNESGTFSSLHSALYIAKIMEPLREIRVMITNGNKSYQI